MFTQQEARPSSGLFVLLLAALTLAACSRADEPTPSYQEVPTWTSTPADNPHASSTATPRSPRTPRPPTAVLPTRMPRPTAVPPTATTTPKPMVTINNDINVRQGPGTGYPVIGTASPGQQYPITGKDPGDEWWKINYNGQAGWVFGQLVTATNARDVPIANRPTSTPRPHPTRTPRLTAAPACALEDVPEPPVTNLDCETWETSYILWSLELGRPAPASQLFRIATEVYPVIEASAQACSVPPMQFGLYIMASAEQLKLEGKPSSSPNTPIAYLIGYFDTLTVTGVLKETVRRTGGCVEAFALLAAMIE